MKKQDDIDKTLESALKDWQPDASAEAETVNPPESGHRVTLIEDPYGFGLPEINEQQGLDEELVLDELILNDEQTENDLANISQAIQRSDADYLQTVEILTADSAQESAQRLAIQIAEDVALSAALAAEFDSSDLDAESPQESRPLDLIELQSSIETLLFLSEQPLKLQKLHEMISPDMPIEPFRDAIAALTVRYQQPIFGIELAQIAGGYQLRTKPSLAHLAKKLTKTQTQRLSTGAMESLAIIAHRQPVMKEDIDQIRGVDSSHFIRGLMEKRLIAISSRSELPGRPMLYVTTPEFLQIFGLNDLSALPSLRELEQMIPTSQSQSLDDEDPRVRDMRRMVSDMNHNAQSILNYDPREDEKILKEIRERVQQIPTSTPTLLAQEEAARQAASQLLESAANASQ